MTDLQITDLQTNDLELAQRAARGDDDAFRAIYQANRGRVLALCQRMTENLEDAEDAAQETFLQVWRKLATFRGGSRLSTWIYRIAVNTVLMSLRRPQSKPNLVSLEAISEELDGFCPPAELSAMAVTDGRLTGTLDRLALTRAIAHLPKGMRAVFLMKHVEGLEHPEIADALASSEGASKSQLHKARKKLKTRLSIGGVKARLLRARLALKAEL